MGEKIYEVAHFDTVAFEDVDEFRVFRRKKKCVVVLRTVDDWMLFKAKVVSDETGSKIKDLDWSKLTSCIRYYRAGLVDIPTLSLNVHNDAWTVKRICDWIQSHNHSKNVFKESNWKDCRKPDRLSSALPMSEIQDLLEELQNDIQ